MLRQGNTRPLHWADKTMSVLRADQLEACEKNLAGLPSCSLFDPSCTDVNAEELYDFSWYASEDRLASRPPVLHTVEQLRARVLAAFPLESLLLSPDEYNLFIRLTVFGGRVVIHDWNNLIPALSLIRRLWCFGEWKNGILTLKMPRSLCVSALLLLSRDEHKHFHDIIDEVHINIENTLYLMGMMNAVSAVSHLEYLLRDQDCEEKSALIRRMLQATYDYIFDPDGNLLLIHPGLADPDRMVRDVSAAFRTREYQELNSNTLNEASDSISDLEDPIYDQMLGIIQGEVRPELSPEDAVEDLIILAKQGVPYKDMAEVLSSMLISLPSPEMLQALKNLSSQIPRWLYFSSSRVQ